MNLVFFPDLHSPQLISRKLMSLSEEAGAEEKKNRGKKGKETKRSASVSSHELSPSSSPYLPPKHNNVNKQVGELLFTISIYEGGKCFNQTWFLSLLTTAFVLPPMWNRRYLGCEFNPGLSMIVNYKLSKILKKAFNDSTEFRTRDLPLTHQEYLPQTYFANLYF